MSRMLIITITTLSVLLSACSAFDNDNADAPGQTLTQLKLATDNKEFASYYKTRLRQVVEADSLTPAADEIDAGNQASMPGGEGGGIANTTGDVAAAPQPVSGGESRFSGTNLVEAGVDEADIMKTDGQFLYTAKRFRMNYNNILLASDGSMTPTRDPEPVAVRILLTNSETATAREVGHITLPADIYQIKGLYLRDTNTATVHADQLIIIAARHETISDPQKDGTELANAGSLIARSSSYSMVFAWNVSDPENPVQQWAFSVEGYFIDSRRINNRLYLASQKYVWPSELIARPTTDIEIARNNEIINKLDVGSLMPLTMLNDEAQSVVETTDCLVPQIQDPHSVFGATLFSLITLPLDTPDQASSLCTLESSRHVYASPNAVYLTRGEWLPEGGTNTVIHKLGFTDSGAEYAASGRVQGSIWGGGAAFRLNEHDQYLRVLTTTRLWNRVRFATDEPRDWMDHHLFIMAELDNSPHTLSIIATLPNDAHPEEIGKPGEDLKSVRFLNDEAYLVTFLTTDPFYRINMVDPSNPFLDGELELPGYSDYLHPLGDNLILGVGHDAEIQNNIAWIQGIKLGLFDVSNGAEPAAIGEISIGKRGSMAAVSQDYKAFAITHDASTDRYRISLPVRVHERLPDRVLSDPPPANTGYYWSYTGTELFEVRNASSSPELTRAGTLFASQWDENNSATPVYFGHTDARTTIIDDSVYYINQNRVWSALWSNPEQVNGPQ